MRILATLGVILLLLSSCYDLNNPLDLLSASYDQRLVDTTTSTTTTLASGILTDGTYRIINVGSALSMKVSAFDGSPVYNSTYTSGDDQKWQVTGLGSGLYSIKKLVADGAITNDGGGAVTSKPYTAAVNQQWLITELTSGVYRMENAAVSATVLDTFDGNPMQAQTYDGSDDRFKWQFLFP